MRAEPRLVRVGIHSGQQYESFADLLALWLRAEELGYDWVSLFDHFRPPLGGPSGPCLEGTTALAALAARTERVRCAMLVSAVTWRHPAILAAAAATIDHISGGRLELGIGAGGPDLAYGQYGIAFPPDRVRLGMLDEACDVLRALWEHEQASFDGAYFRLDRARLAPKPRQSRLPLIVGGAGERHLLRIAARHADTWNTLASDPRTYRHKLDVLAGHCADAGRDPAGIRTSVTFRALLAEDERQARNRRDRLRQVLPADSPDWPEYLVFGTPRQCLDQLWPYLEMGVGDFVLGTRPPLDWTTIELFATAVAPVLRSARAAAPAAPAAPAGS